jgi:hypothetical protein
VENAFKKNPDLARAKAAPYEQYPYPKFARPLFVGAGLAGFAVEMHYYPGQDHNGTVNASLVDSVPFAKKLFAGQRIAGNCASVKPPPSGN